MGRANGPGEVKQVARGGLLLTCVSPYELFDGPLIWIILTLLHLLFVKELLQGKREVAPGVIAEHFLILIILNFNSILSLFLLKLIHLLLCVVKHDGDELLLDIVNLRLGLAVRAVLGELLGEAAPLPDTHVPHQLVLLLAGIFGVYNKLGQALHPN